MIETIQRFIIASYGMPVDGALLLDKEDAQCLAEEAPGGIIEHDGHAWRVASIEIEECSEESGILAVMLEMIETATA